MPATFIRESDKQHESNQNKERQQTKLEVEAVAAAFGPQAAQMARPQGNYDRTGIHNLIIDFNSDIIKSFNALGLKAAPRAAIGRHLEVGEKAEVKLDTSNPRFNSGLIVKPGESYRINATGKWRDGDLPECDAKGFLSSDLEWWRRPIFGAARLFRPVGSGSRWCSLVADVSGRQPEEIGSRLPAVIETKHAGSLQFFVNDVIFGNNKGNLSITIERLKK